MHDTTQMNAFYAQAQAVRAQMKPLEAELKKLNDDIATINYQGQRAMEKITKDQSIPLLERLKVFFDAPAEFTMCLPSRPSGKCKAMQSAIDYATEDRNRYDVIDLNDMASDAWRDYEANPEAVAWWAKEEGYLAKDFLEEMLQRSLLTFNCY